MFSIFSRINLFDFFLPPFFFISFPLVLVHFSPLWCKNVLKKIKKVLEKSQCLMFLTSELYFQNSRMHLYDDLIFSDKPRILISFPGTHQHPGDNF